MPDVDQPFVPRLERLRLAVELGDAIASSPLSVSTLHVTSGVTAKVLHHLLARRLRGMHVEEEVRFPASS